MASDLTIGFLDDVKLGGNLYTGASDVDMFMARGEEMSLRCNVNKCEIISTTNLYLQSDTLKNFTFVKIGESCLLGAPLLSGTAMDTALADRYNDLDRAIDRLRLLSAHDAIVLLRV